MYVCDGHARLTSRQPSCTYVCLYVCMHVRMYLCIYVLYVLI